MNRVVMCFSESSGVELSYLQRRQGRPESRASVWSVSSFGGFVGHSIEFTPNT